MEEQVQEAYSRLADQRGIPVDNDDDLFRDQNTARDARNAVEQVISHVYPEADGGTGPGAAKNPARNSEVQQGSNRPVREQSITLSPDEVEEAPAASEADTARQNYGNFLDRVGTRVAMESHGQDILDRMEEAGESPRDVSDKFWNETYFDLPAPVQQRFTRMLKNVSGFEPGDTIAVRPDKSGIVAKDWADVAKGMLPEKAEHLEGTERGLTALMKEANDRFAQDRNSTQQASDQLQPRCAAGVKAGAESFRGYASAPCAHSRAFGCATGYQARSAGRKRLGRSCSSREGGSCEFAGRLRGNRELSRPGDEDRSREDLGRAEPHRKAVCLEGEGRNRPVGAAVRSVPTQDLTLDPKRFQYKLNTSPEGVTDLLKGKRWNDDLAGVVSVWQDPADGKTYVVNGHHRAMLAKETGTPEVAVRYLKAPDAASARAIGALQNIAEGRGTPVDAAKFFRDSGLTPADLEAKGISMGEATAANGLALSRLSPQLFDDAVSGKLRQGRAIAIGKAAPEVEQQEALLKLIDRAEAKGQACFGRHHRGAGPDGTRAPRHTPRPRTRSLARRSRRGISPLKRQRSRATSGKHSAGSAGSFLMSRMRAAHSSWVPPAISSRRRRTQA